MSGLEIRYKNGEAILSKKNEFDVGVKGQNKKKTNSVKHAAMVDLLSKYERYLIDFNTHLTAHEFNGLANTINEYRDFARVSQVAHNLPKATIYSSILEELPTLLCQSYVKKRIEALSDKLPPDLQFLLGPSKCLIRVCCTPIMKKYEEVKNVDFTFAAYSQDLNHWIVLVGFEVKRYCDKTMHTTIVHTATALSTLRAMSFYGFLVEDEARGQEVIENTQLLDREFLLTGEYRPGEEKDYDLFPFRADKLREFYTFLIAQVDLSLNRIITSYESRQEYLKKEELKNLKEQEKRMATQARKKAKAPSQSHEAP